ncbi:hypothetical protein QL285_076146 [Trifolium repens]|nr:hypothetical protein QL285_076146 [Trifolium repens]
MGTLEMWFWVSTSEPGNFTLSNSLSELGLATASSTDRLLLLDAAPFCSAISIVLGFSSEFWWLEFVAVAGLRNKFKAPLQVNRIFGARTR